MTLLIDVYRRKGIATSEHQYLCISLQYNGFGVKPVCVPEYVDFEYAVLFD
jgi:hypothetical protein